MDGLNAVEADRRDKTGCAPGLQGGDQHGQVPGVLGDLASPLFSFTLQALQVRYDRTEQLQHNGGRDVGHDAHGENGRLGEGAAGEQVEQTKNGLLGERGCQHGPIDARGRDMATDPVDNKQAEGKENPSAQLFDLEDGFEGFQH